jgi:hypothetical protein
MFQHQGLLGIAKENYQDALARHCHDGFMANTAYTLTKLHIHEGKLKEAKGMYEQALAGNERTLGDSQEKTKIGLSFQLTVILCCHEYLMGWRMVWAM